jgi:NAD(P)H-dependent FMN reductase
MRILAISGSLQRNSSNVKLLHTAAASAPSGVEIVMFDGLRHLPQFDPDLELNEPLPVVEAWRRAIVDADALIIASPEYGFSLPGALKNAIDWVIGSGELERRVVAVTASVNHADRGRRGLEALCNTLHAVAALIVGAEPIVRGPDFESNVSALMGKLVAVVEREKAGATH